MRLVQATALVQFSNSTPWHLAALRAIHRQLTGGRVDCPRYGQHWEEVGFQGSDPATDLRGVGMLGVMQALYLSTTPELLPFARDVFSLSRHPSQEFPLLVLSLNLTRICLHCLRDGILDRNTSNLMSTTAHSRQTLFGGGSCRSARHES